MSFKAFNKLFIILGILTLLHAAYSAAQHRTYLRITGQEATWLPIDIIVQALISLIVLIYNILQLVGEFKEIRAAVDLQGKSWDTLGNLPSFYHFNHRGRGLSPDYEIADLKVDKKTTGKIESLRNRSRVETLQSSD